VWVQANKFVDVLDFTVEMRKDRMAMIQHPPQYKFACFAVAQYILTLLKHGVLTTPPLVSKSTTVVLSF
jgi:hypothetical protein